MYLLLKVIFDEFSEKFIFSITALYLIYVFGFLFFSISLMRNCVFCKQAGRFLGELTKQVFSDLSASKYQVSF